MSNKTIYIVCVFTALMLAAAPALAQVPLLSFPTGADSAPAFINKLYQFGIGIAGILAVAMIVVGGIYYSVSGAVDKRAEGKDMILSALLGVVLLFGSWILLKTVNPRLVELGLPAPAGATTTLRLTAAEYCTPLNSLGPCNIDQGEQPSRPPGSSTCTCYIPNVTAACNRAQWQLCALRKVTGGGTIPPNRIPDCGTGSSGCQERIIYSNRTIQLPVSPLSSYWQYPYYPKNRGGGSSMCIIYAWRGWSSVTNSYTGTGRASINGLVPC